MERFGILPADGFAWRFILVFALHAGALYFLVTRMQQPVSIILAGEPAGGGGGAVVDSVPLDEVNWVDASMTAPEIRLPKPPPIAANEPESDLPLLPQAKEPLPPPLQPALEPETKPEPMPEPPKEVALRPIPKPEPPKEAVLKPVPKPEPPKTVVLKPAPVPLPQPQPAPESVPPKPKPKPVVLKPALPPAPKPAVVAAKPVVPKPIPTPTSAPTPKLPPTPANSPAPVRAVPVAGPVTSTPGAGTGMGNLAAGAGGFGSGPGGDGGPTSDISAFHLRVKDAYISQWQQPYQLVESGSKYRVRVEIVIGRTGNVVSARVVARSGNAEMDRSVQEAVSRVSQVDPLPAGIGGGTYAILLNFDI